jgi:hypothetical protein
MALAELCPYTYSYFGNDFSYSKAIWNLRWQASHRTVKGTSLQKILAEGKSLENTT